MSIFLISILFAFAALIKAYFFQLIEDFCEPLVGNF